MDLGFDLGSLEEYLGLLLFLFNVALGSIQVPFMTFLKSKFEGLQDRSASLVAWGIAIGLAFLGMFLSNSFMDMEWSFAGVTFALMTLRATSETVYHNFVREK